jgi:hypothetical protein
MEPGKGGCYIACEMAAVRENAVSRWDSSLGKLLLILTEIALTDDVASPKLKMGRGVRTDMHSSPTGRRG